MSARACAALLTVVAGCGHVTARTDWAEPQALRLGGDEPCGPAGRAVDVELRRLVLDRNRWRVEAAVRNHTGVPLSILRPHTDETFFGLAVFRGHGLREVAARADRRAIHVQLVADRFEPAMPRRLDPGDGWSGAFSGPGRLPRGRIVRVVTGRFATLARPPRGLFAQFVCVSERGRRVR